MRLLNAGRRGMSHVVRHRESAGMALTRGARTRGSRCGEPWRHLQGTTFGEGVIFPAHLFLSEPELGPEAGSYTRHGTLQQTSRGHHLPPSVGSMRRRPERFIGKPTPFHRCRFALRHEGLER